MATLPDGRMLPGKLIIVEGIDGSGKSTQLDLLRKYLIGEGYCVAFSEWNSSPIVGGVTRRGKKKQLLTPLSFSLIHAADFSDRMERQMLPALKAGAIVLADRYIYTAFGRDVARGLDPDYVRKLYSFAIRPTIAFYFRVPLEESLNRILTGRPQLKYYEAGLDIGLSEDPYESFTLFQSRILEEYDRMVDEFGLTVIDATRPLLEQQEEVRQIAEPHLHNVISVKQSAWAEVLTKKGLHGRYLEHIFPEQAE
nr:thymidylate kinase [Anaerolineae bacterium]